MRFGRTAPSAPLPVEERPLPAPVLAPAPAQGDLSTISLEALFAEVKRRGWEIFPAGSWTRVVGELESQLETHSAQQRNVIDGTELVRKIGHIAGVEYPKVVDETIALRTENGELDCKLARCEQEAELLGGVILAELYEDEEPA